MVTLLKPCGQARTQMVTLLKQWDQINNTGDDLAQKNGVRIKNSDDHFSNTNVVRARTLMVTLLNSMIQKKIPGGHYNKGLGTR